MIDKIRLIFKDKCMLLIAIVLVVHCIVSMLWLRINTYFYGPDEFSHLLHSEFLMNNILSDDWLKPFVYFEYRWPPLYFILVAFVGAIFANVQIGYFVVNVFLWIVLLFSVRLISRYLYDDTVSILSLVFMSFCPGLFVYSRFCNLDFALTAIFCLNWYFLLRSDYFYNKKYTFLWGLSFAAGLLIKQAFIFFGIAPVVFSFIIIFFVEHRSRTIKRQIIGNLIMSGFCILICILPWYINKFYDLLWTSRVFLSSFFSGAIASEPRGGSSFPVFGFFWYIEKIVFEQLSIIIFLGLLLSLLFFAVKQKNRLYCVCIFCVPYLFLSFSSMREVRYLMPLIPVVIIIMSAGIAKMGSFLKVFISVVLFGVLFFQFLWLSFFSGANVINKFDVQKQGFLFNAHENHHGLRLGVPAEMGDNFKKIADFFHEYYGDLKCEVYAKIFCSDFEKQKIYDYPGALQWYFKNAGISNIKFLSESSTSELNIFFENINDMPFIFFITDKSESFQTSDITVEFDGALRRYVAYGKERSKSFLGKIDLPITALDIYSSDTNFNALDLQSKVYDFLENIKNDYFFVGNINLADNIYVTIFERKKFTAVNNIYKTDVMLLDEFQCKDNNEQEIFYYEYIGNKLLKDCREIFFYGKHKVENIINTDMVMDGELVYTTNAMLSEKFLFEADNCIKNKNRRETLVCYEHVGRKLTNDSTEVFFYKKHIRKGLVVNGNLADNKLFCIRNQLYFVQKDVLSLLSDVLFDCGQKITNVKEEVFGDDIKISYWLDKCFFSGFWLTYDYDRNNEFWVFSAFCKSEHILNNSLLKFKFLLPDEMSFLIENFYTKKDISEKVGIILDDSGCNFLAVHSIDCKGEFKDGYIFDWSRISISSCVQVTMNDKCDRQVLIWVIPQSTDDVSVPFFGLSFKPYWDESKFLSDLKKCILREENKQKIIIDDENLQLTFNAGIADVFFDGKKITDGFGIYTSFLHEGIWRDSQNAIWHVIDNNDRELLIKGVWVNVPIEQTWKLCFVDKGVLEWNVELKAVDNVYIEKMQANFMLRKVYGDKVQFSDSESKCNGDNGFCFIVEKEATCNNQQIFSADFLDSDAVVLSAYSNDIELQENRQISYSKTKLKVKKVDL